MRPAVILLLTASVSAFAAADDPGPSSPHTDVRRELLSEFKYVAQPKDTPPSAPFLSNGAQQHPVAEPDASDVVEMAPYTIRETVRMNTLHADILQEKADARTAQIMARLGVGLHVVPAGPVAFYAATIFYIPFAAGIGISW